MNQYTMVVAIVAIVLFAGVMQHYLKLQARRPSEAEEAEREEVQRKLARVDELEERVRVLERIVVDRKERLREEIDAL